jgi:hypothetical protein
MAATEHHEILRNPEVAYEPSDASPGPVVLTGVGLAVVVIICALVVLGLLAWNFRTHAETPSEAPPIARGLRVFPPEPRLQSAPRIDYEQFRSDQLSILEGSGWVDRERGIAHIPIADAMRIIAQRGIPPQQTPEDLKLTTPQSGSRSTGFEGRVPQEPK